MHVRLVRLLNAAGVAAPQEGTGLAAPQRRPWAIPRRNQHASEHGSIGATDQLHFQFTAALHRACVTCRKDRSGGAAAAVLAGPAAGGTLPSTGALALPPPPPTVPSTGASALCVAALAAGSAAAWLDAADGTLPSTGASALCVAPLAAGWAAAWLDAADGTLPSTGASAPCALACRFHPLAKHQFTRLARALPSS